MLTDKRRVRLYGVFPFAVGLLFVALFFSGVEVLQSIASPAGQREFGLIENTQNLILISAMVLCWRAACRETALAWRWLWRLGTFACFVFFMEEIDWGDHYWNAFTGRVRPRGEHFSFHNQGDLHTWIKRSVDVSFTVFFIFIPLGAKKLPARLRPFVPDLHSVLTLLSGLLVSQLAHTFEDLDWSNNGSLHHNISEFRESFTYWVVLLYLWELTRRRRAEA